MEVNIKGQIKAMNDLPYGLVLKIRETKNGITSKNGHDWGSYDNTWDFIVNKDADIKYIKTYFRVGAIVTIFGWADKCTSKDPKSSNPQYTVYRIKNIDFFNMGDPKRERKRERYNSKVVGDEVPDVNNNFESDF